MYQYRAVKIKGEGDCQGGVSGLKNLCSSFVK